jgi:carboxyl-terminal processing protease
MRETSTTTRPILTMLAAGLIACFAGSARAAANLPTDRRDAAKIAPAPTHPDSSAWLDAFDTVWSVTARQFVDETLRGLDWAEIRERYRPLVERAASRDESVTLINDMLARLHTSHTRYYTSDDPAYYFLLDLFRHAKQVAAVAERCPGGRPSFVGIGVFTETIDGAEFVRAIVDGGPASRSGLKVGDRLLTVEDQPWHAVRSFAGREGATVGMRVQREEDPSSVLTIEVVPQRIVPTEFYLRGLSHSARRLHHRGRTIGYARVWSWAGEENQELLARLLEEQLASAEALLLDLRDGWGGASPLYLNLFNTRIPTMVRSSRDGTSHSWGPAWPKPVALLVDGTTRSGKELIAYGFRRYGYGPVVGERTAGAVTAGGCIPVGDHGLLYLAVGDVLVDGERLEGRGVAPDLEVTRRVPYAAGKDEQLQAALDLLVDQLEAGRGGGD